MPVVAFLVQLDCARGKFVFMGFGSMRDCLVAFGSNVGDASRVFERTRQDLADNPQIKSLCGNDVITTQPIGGPVDQTEFLNACFRFQTDLPIERLFDFLRLIERKFGRQRGERWGDRIIDLDLLLYGDCEWNRQNLVVPHPRMTFRRFVLHPARLVASEMIHPTSGLSVSELIEHLDTMPRRIVAAAAASPDWNCVASSLIEVCRTHRWDFESASDLPSFENMADQAKLVVYTDEVESQLLERARRHPGPTLKLGKHDPQDAQTELTAAIKAMSVL